MPPNIIFITTDTQGQEMVSAYLASLRPSRETYPKYYHHYYDCNTFVDYEIGRVLDAVEQFSPENTV